MIQHLRLIMMRPNLKLYKRKDDAFKEYHKCVIGMCFSTLLPQQFFMDKSVIYVDVVNVQYFLDL